jgi:O-antigen ligase
LTGLDWRGDRGLLILIAAMAVVAAGYPSYLFHPVTLLAPVVLLAALLVVDKGRLTQPVWLIATAALLLWTVLLFLAMAGTANGLIFSVAMYSPFAALAYRIRRPESTVLIFAVAASALLSIRVLASWFHSGAQWLPWKVYEGNDLSSRLVLLLPVVLVAWQSLPSRRRWARWALLMLVAVGVASIVLTQHRAGLVMLVVLFVIWLARTNWKALGVVAAGVVVASVVAWQPLLAALERVRLVNFKNSAATRPEIWRVALDAWRESSWLGVGPGNTATALGTVDDVHAHNGLLQAGLEAGWPGAVLYACLVVYLFVLSVRLLRLGGKCTLWALPLLAYIGFSILSAPLQRPDLTLALVLVVFAARERMVPRGVRCAP